MHFIKAGFVTKIYQISEFQNHFQTKSTYFEHFYFLDLSRKVQFAMTDPVVCPIPQTFGPSAVNVVWMLSSGAHRPGNCPLMTPCQNLTVI